MEMSNYSVINDVFEPPLAVNPSLQANFILNDQSIAAFKSRVVDGLSVLSQQFENRAKPFSGIAAEQLRELFSCLSLEQPLHSFSAALDELKSLYFNDAVYFHDGQYMAHLNCPIVYPAVIAELLLAAINSSMDTWDQSAGATLIEQKLINWTCQKIGFDDHADGIFTSGGTQSNLMGLMLARDNFCFQNLAHNVRTQGLPAQADKLRVMTSKHAHFSVQKSLALLGLGFQSVIAIDSDAQYRMCPQALERALQVAQERAELPFAIVATAGTTDFGSIDNLTAIAAVARRFNVWLHVDAAYGGGLLISNQHRQRINGIELADSVTIDFHKTFFQPVSCGAFFLRDRKNFNYLTYHADYLNPANQDPEERPNLVNKSIQTTRRFDALKLWLSLRVIGADVLGGYFDQVINLAAELYQTKTLHQDFEFLHHPELSALVFRYRCSDDSLNCHVNEAVRKKLFTEGDIIIAGTKVDGESYLKVTLLNPNVDSQQLIARFGAISAMAKQLEQECVASVGESHD